MTITSARTTVAGLVLALVAATLVLLAPAPAHAWEDKDCEDFATQAEAQVFYEANGGPTYDPHHLDIMHDGQACEMLPCPCASTTPDPSWTTPPVTSPTTSTAPMSGKVSTVVDADTVKVTSGVALWKVHLLGVTTKGCSKSQGTQVLRDLLREHGKKLVLTADPAVTWSQGDGSMLRYAKLDGADLGKRLLKKGAVRVDRAYTGLAKASTYLAAQAKAPRNGAC